MKNKTPVLTETLSSILEQEKIKTASLPIRLKIPKINVDANFEYLGLVENEKVSVPTSPMVVAWFNLSAYPGEVGTSVLSGHAGYKDNKPAVFDDLYKLKRGDKIYIENLKGEIITFVVRDLKSYDRNATVQDVFFSNDGLSYLNLITCTGDWDELEKSHFERLVVFTEREI